MLGLVARAAARRTPFFGGRALATQAGRKAHKRTPHAVLGIAIGADKSDIKRAFLSRAQETHPDKPDGDKHEFRRVQEAYEALRTRGEDGETPAHRGRVARAAFTAAVRDLRETHKANTARGPGARRSELGRACADARTRWDALVKAAEASPTDAAGRLDGEAASLVLDLCVLEANAEGQDHGAGLARARKLLDGLRPALFAAHRDREEAYNALLRLSAADGLGSDCTSFAMDVVGEMEKQKLQPDLGLLTQVIFPRFGAGASGY